MPTSLRPKIRSGLGLEKAGFITFVEFNMYKLFKIGRYKYLFLIIFANFLIVKGTVAYTQTLQNNQPSSSDFIWPISGSTTPDLPQSSAFGPRLKASENYRYDYHQGIDIPTPVGTPILAVLSGTIRIAGSHPLYQDGVVQIDHGDNLYSNYIHISKSLVITGQVVGQGEPIALSGVSDSGFPHLHFEIRDGSVWREDTVNPWRYLPYSDTIRHTIAITEMLNDNAVWVQATTPADELDIQTISITVKDSGSNQILGNRVFDFEAWNKSYNGRPELLDNPDMGNMFIKPHIFVTNSTLYVIDVKFYRLPGQGPVEVIACVLDVNQNEVCTAQQSQFDGLNIYLPGIQNQTS